MDTIWTPAFTLSAEGKDITPVISEYLTSLTYTDFGSLSEEPRADQLQIELAAPDIKIPPKGAKLHLALGFGEMLVDKGWFIVDSVTLSGPPRQLSITALAVPYNGDRTGHSMTSQKTRTWEGLTVGEIVKTIAQENGLVPAVSPDLAGIVPGWLAQDGESDASLLTRLAHDLDAFSKPTQGYWVFKTQESGESVTGKPLPALVLTPEAKTRWQYSNRTRHKKHGRRRAAAGKQLQVQYRDGATGKTLMLAEGKGETIQKVGFTFPDRGAAERYLARVKVMNANEEAAKKKNSKGQKAPPVDYLQSFSVIQPCTPELLQMTAECKITAQGFDETVDKAWLVEAIAFRLEPGSGLSLEMELKNV